MEKILFIKFISFFAVLAFTPVEGEGQVNHVVISQVYGGGGNAGAIYKNDFIELFNPTGVAVSLNGWSVQYQSSSGIGQWQITNLSGSIMPGQYFLISQEGGPNGVSLPASDVSGGINLSATAGIVAVLNTTTRLNDQLGKPFQCLGCGIVDLVGYGSGGTSEGSANAPAPSSTNSVFRAGDGCLDADNNSTDFSVGTARARNSSSAAVYCYATKLSLPLLSDQTAGVSFSVTIISRDAGNVPKNVMANTFVTLTSNGNGGTISGTTTGTILVGTNSVTLPNVTLSSPGAAVSLTVTPSAGDALAAATSEIFTVNPGQIRTFYSKATGYLNEETTWGTGFDGNGTSPTNFTADNQVFHIRNSATTTISSNWKVSGSNSKIIVGDGTSACNFIIPNTKTVDALIELSPHATLTNSGGSALTLGIVAPTSTVVYNQPNAQPIAAATYGNLMLGGSGSKTMSGNVTVLGTLAINTTSNLVINPGTLLTISGRVEINGGGIVGSINSSLTLNSTPGIILNLPAISLKDLTIEAGNTIVLNGDLNLNGLLDLKGTFDAGVSDNVVRNGGNGAVSISGRFITRDAEGFTGVNASIPGINPILNAGSVVEYARAGNQVVNYRTDYKNIIFSATGIKALSSGFDPAGTITIKDNAIVDASNYTFGNGGNLVMTGGRLKVAGSGNKPDMNTYNLSGGVIEFTGSSASSIRVNPTYLNIEISGTNITNSTSTGSLNLAAGGSFTVKNGGVYKVRNTNGFTGASNTAISSTNSPIITLEGGSTIEFRAETGTQSITGRTDYSNLILSDAALKIMTGSPAIAGNLIVSGGTVSTPETITFNGLIGTQVIAGLEYNNINFSNNSTKQLSTSASVSSNGTLLLSAGVLDLNNNKITLKAGTGNNYPKMARVGPVSLGASISYGTSGAFVVERYIPPLRRFRFISPSVNAPGTIKQNWMEGQNNPSTDYNSYQDFSPGYGTHITGKGGAANGFDETITNNPSLFIYNNRDQVWGEVQEPDSTGLTAGSAWRLFVRGSRNTDLNNNFASPSPTILRTTGKLVIGPFTFSQIGGPAGTNIIPVLNPATNAYNFIGNPYASAVDWDKLEKVGLRDEYSVSDPSLSDGTSGVYVTWNNTLKVNNIHGSNVNGNIQPGQGFFVTATGNSSTSLTFNEDDKSDAPNTQVFRPATERTTLSVQLLLNTGAGNENIADGLVAVFDDEFSGSVDTEDSYKFPNIKESLEINRDGKGLSIEGRPSVTRGDTLPLKIYNYGQNDYWLKISGKNFPLSLTAFLQDAFLKTETALDLTTPSIIPFVITEAPSSSAPDRFQIVFKNSEVLPLTVTDVKASALDKGVRVDWTAQTETSIRGYEIEKSLDGQHFHKVESVPARDRDAISENYSWLDGNSNSGNNYYRIKVIEKSGEVDYSKIVIVNIASGKSGLAVFPNPVRDNVINFKLINMEKGRYELTLLNSQGQKLYKKVIENKGAGNFSISTGKPLNKGAYLLTLTNGDTIINETLMFK